METTNHGSFTHKNVDTIVPWANSEEVTTLRTVHQHRTRADGRLVCVGCGVDIIHTSHGSRVAPLGRTLQPDEIACGQ